MGNASLEIEIIGSATSNVIEYRAAVLERISAENKELETDEDFLRAEGVVKYCKEEEDRIKGYISQAKKQSLSLSEFFEAVEAVDEVLRSTRLALSKQVKDRKAEIRAMLIHDALNDICGFAMATAAKLQINQTIFPMDHRGALESSIKGKSSLEKIKEALDLVVASKRLTIEQTFSEAASKMALVNAQGAKHLFGDIDRLITLPIDELTFIIGERGKAEAARLEEVKAEERIKATHEAQAKETPPVVTLPPEEPTVEQPAYQPPPLPEPPQMEEDQPLQKFCIYFTGTASHAETAAKLLRDEWKLEGVSLKHLQF